jgi:hypothetical protein
MKIIINERQLRTIIESEKKISDKKLKAYKETVDELGVDYAAELFDKEPWELIEMGVVESYGGEHKLQLSDTPIKSLGNLRHVDGILYLEDTIVKSLGKLESVTSSLIVNYSPLESLGDLRTVGGDLRLIATNIKDFGKLESVGGDLDIRATPLAKLQERKIRSMINVGGEIYKKL